MILCEYNKVFESLNEYEDMVKRKKALVAMLHYDTKKLSLDIEKLNRKLFEEKIHMVNEK